MNIKETQFLNSWAIILGGSSGFGFAAVEKLTALGMNIAVLYRETAITEKPLKQKFINLSETNNVQIVPFNINALDISALNLFIEQFSSITGKKKCVKLLLHSIARGNLKPLVVPGNNLDKQQETLTAEDIKFTTYAMSTSILDGTRGVLNAGLFEEDARIIGLTSEGAHKYWQGYAAVSIAKAALESLNTYMAVEFGKYGLKTNLIQAGITETPSLKKIDESEKLIDMARERNPLGRITQPADVANVISLLCRDEASWINGSIIHVDGGEHCR